MPWNEAFDSHAVAVPDAGTLPRIQLGADPPVTLTLLSPPVVALGRLGATWDRELARLQAAERTPEGAKADRAGTVVSLDDLDGLAGRRSEIDTAPANGSSIAFLLEADGLRALFAADAHPDVLAASIRRLNAERGTDRLGLDAFKLPHHASEANVSAEVLELVSCRRYLVSTNGAYFNHPDPAAIARVIVHGGEAPELHFNYRSARTELWADPARVGRGQYAYTPVYPVDKTGGIRLRLPK
jgi:hypothetical protein